MKFGSIILGDNTHPIFALLSFLFVVVNVPLVIVAEVVESLPNA